MTRKLISISLVSLLFISFMLPAFAHPGRTDSKGGHWDRANSEYHYHNGEYAGRTQSASKSSSKGHSYKESDDIRFFILTCLFFILCIPIKLAFDSLSEWRQRRKTEKKSKQAEKLKRK